MTVLHADSSPFKREARRGMVFGYACAGCSTRNHPDPNPPLEGEGTLRLVARGAML